MRALLLYTIVFTAGALAACASQSDHKIGISHKLPNQAEDSANVSAKAQALMDASKNKKCLDLESVTRELGKDASLYSVYTADLDLGQIKNASGNNGKCVQFVPNGDDTTRAVTFLKSDLRPQIETLAGTDLAGSNQIGAYLSVTSQDKCSNVALVKGSFAILCKSARELTVQGTIDGAQSVIQYSLGDKNLLITTYTPMRAATNCKIAGNTVVRRTTVVSWSGADKMLVAKSFAQLFQNYLVTKPTELTAAVANPKITGNISLSSQTYSYMINMLSLDKKINAALTCN